MENEIKRRLAVLNTRRAPEISARLLRGGMQERLYRREAIGYGNRIANQKKELNSKLAALRKEKSDYEKTCCDKTPESGAIISAFSSSVTLKPFKVPVKGKIRNQNGWFR
jgi:hypothetical protein